MQSCDVFKTLSVYGLIDERIMCMHGRLSPEIRNVDQFCRLVRPCIMSEKDIVIHHAREGDRVAMHHVRESCDESVPHCIMSEKEIVISEASTDRGAKVEVATTVEEKHLWQMQKPKCYSSLGKTCCVLS